VGSGPPACQEVGELGWDSSVRPKRFAFPVHLRTHRLPERQPPCPVGPAPILGVPPNVRRTAPARGAPREWFPVAGLRREDVGSIGGARSAARYWMLGCIVSPRDKRVRRCAMWTGRPPTPFGSGRVAADRNAADQPPFGEQPGTSAAPLSRGDKVAPVGHDGNSI
jgi:hypothetical protein